MAYKSIEDLKKHRVFYNFLEISKISRQTFFEKEVNDFILNWAKNLGLEVYQDKKNNLLIRKPATAGYEKQKPIVIQAHIDMVLKKDLKLNMTLEKTL